MKSYDGIKSTTKQKIYETETKVIVHPSPLIARYVTNRGIRFTFKKSYFELQTQITSFYAVPNDALIFEFSRKGNLEGVQALLSRVGSFGPRY